MWAEISSDSFILQCVKGAQLEMLYGSYSPEIYKWLKLALLKLFWALSELIIQVDS